MKVQSLEVIAEQLEGDTLTPISVYKRISGKKKFLLESSYKHHESGRFSFIGADPVYELISKDGKTLLKKDGAIALLDKGFSEALKELLPKIDSRMDIPFIGGSVGYIGYDFVREMEEIGSVPSDPFDMPDAHLMFFNELIVFDHVKQKIILVGILFPDQNEKLLIERLEKRKKELASDDSLLVSEGFSMTDFRSSQSQDVFEQSVKKAKELIEVGEVFQVVLSRRLTAKTDGDPFSFYRKLRVNNASPYMYFLDFEDYVIAGSSPESLVKYRNGTITANPIAGTRPRGETPEIDAELEDELRQDEKELAEHKMLIDLSRNDLGRICKIGSVEVSKYMEIERYQYVMHLVSEVTGTLAPGAHPIDGLSASLPAGTVSGAPKIRAMQIINELEPQKRGVYAGAVGYFSACGAMDFALAIRTMVVKGNKGYFQAGAGIVHDSDPAKEYEETNHKLKAMMEAADDSSY